MNGWRDMYSVGARLRAISWHGRLARVPGLTGGTPVPRRTIARKRPPTCRAIALGVLASAAAAVSLRAQILPPLAVPAPADTKTLRVWTTVALTPVVERWRAGFLAVNPSVRVELKAAGSDVTMAGLYTGRADLALLGREATAPELKAFEWVFRHPPFRVEILNGSLAGRGRSPALVVCVHPENPLAQISLTELEAAFAAAPTRGAARPIRTWDQLGLADKKWAGQGIRLYTFDTESGTGRFFREKVLGGSRHLNWAALTELADTEPPTPPSHDAAEKIVAALARDLFGLAVTAGAVGDKRVKILPHTAGGFATRASVIDRSYPLGRIAYGYASRRPGAPLDPLVAAFLRHALSAEGQPTAEPDYLPLSAAIAAEQQRRLD